MLRCPARCAQMREPDVIALDDVCRRLGRPRLLVARSYGLIGYLRVRAPHMLLFHEGAFTQQQLCPPSGAAAEHMRQLTKTTNCTPAALNDPTRARGPSVRTWRALEPDSPCHSPPARLHLCSTPHAGAHTMPQASLPEHRVVESKPDSQVDDLR
jgi:hypothetical protein